MKKSCEACGGSGQVSFFLGVSRFLLSWEECPVCGGLGFIPEPAAEANSQDNESAGAETADLTSAQKKPAG